MQVGVRQINGVDTEVHADPHGSYSIVVEGKTIGSGITLDAAITQARNSLNRDKTTVNIEFITKGSGERGVATGFHSRNRTIMARIADGKSEQLEYNYKAFKPDMPPKDLDRYFAIRSELARLKGEQQTLESTYQINLREVVERAITEAQTKSGKLGDVVARAAARRQDRR